MPDEAAYYLGLESHRSLEMVRRDFNLPGFKVGKYFIYHREDLDACAQRMCGKAKRPPTD